MLGAYLGGPWAGVPMPANPREDKEPPPRPQHLLLSATCFNEQLELLPRCLTLTVKGFNCLFSSEKVIKYLKCTENSTLLSLTSSSSWARGPVAGCRAGISALWHAEGRGSERP